MFGILLSGNETSEIAKEVVDVTKEAAIEVNRFTEYLNNHIPDLIGFGIRVLLAFITFFIGSKLIKFVRKIIRKSLERSTVDKGVEQFIDSVVKVLLYAILLFSIASNLGIDTASVAALLASGGVAIGLALQGSLSNFAGGVLILLLKPFVVGDYIIEDSQKNEGTVIEIQIFYTKLSTVDNKIIVIPNGTLANTSLTNVTTSSKRRLDLNIGISYSADLKKAKAVLEQLLQEDESVRKDEEYFVVVDDLSDHAVILSVRAWVNTDEYWTTKWRLLEQIKLIFDENHIEIPYPQLQVHMNGTVEES